ncbi:uncharacterized protein B0H18DRAFT_932831 [Fomitopsis serialis]|uniref:uncharacterized protein n=1 Tax=Fomitopsis serialis TaxID=139415 RepID=UPI0020082B01|nr:uncharacterized protein B0H18DRAFT_932831 [Neoantrodia serialis]KAH9927001.1 hypothetical protein B0H18DRAFT_932831 [Neoantrodia serialis]
MAEPTALSPRTTNRGPKTAPALFSRPDADIILSSSDNTHFRVHRQILSIASPFFETMLGLPQSTTSASGTPPLIAVEEDARTLEDLLRICYPVRDPQLKIHVLTDWQHISNVVHAAMKYDMVQAIEFVKTKLTAGVDVSPLQVFCIACKHGFESVARNVAVKLTAPNAALNTQVIRGVYVSQLEDIPAACYYRLMQAGKSRMPCVDNIVFCGQGDANRCLTVYQEPCAGYRVRDDDGANHGKHTLRSADNVYYSVSQDTFSLFQRAHPVSNIYDSNESGSAVLTLPEDSGTVELLLQLGTRDMNDHAFIASGLRAAAKYKTTTAHAALTTRWLELSNKSPLPSYLIASAYGLKEEAIKSARQLLSWRSEQLREAYIPVMEEVSAGHYFRLLQYHGRCADAADSAVRKSWTKAFVGDMPRHCTGGRCGRGIGATQSRWADTCYTRLKALHDLPRKAVAEDATLVGELCFQVGSCSSCAECISHADIIRFLTTFSKANEEVLMLVDTNILFRNQG